MQCCLISSKWRQRSQKCLVVERRRQATHVSHAIRIFQVTKNWTKKCLAEKLLLPHHPWQGGTCIRWHYWLFVLTFLQIKRERQPDQQKICKSSRHEGDIRQKANTRKITSKPSTLLAPTLTPFHSQTSFILQCQIVQACHRQSRATMVWGNIYPDQAWDRATLEPWCLLVPDLDTNSIFFYFLFVKNHS